MKNQKLSFAPKREIEYIEHSLDETVHTLKAYLKGRLVIAHDETHGTGKRPKKPKYKETDILIFSCAIISRRIIQKYSKGEVPNKPRMSLWKKMLAIISKLEADNVLPRAKIEKWRHNDLVYKCKIYEHRGFQIVIPQQSPKKKMPFRKGWYNPQMEQQFPSHMSEKRSSTMIRQHYTNYINIDPSS
jgi:hypothetical protein